MVLRYVTNNNGVYSPQEQSGKGTYKHNQRYHDQKKNCSQNSKKRTKIEKSSQIYYVCVRSEIVKKIINK